MMLGFVPFVHDAVPHFRVERIPVHKRVHNTLKAFRVVQWLDQLLVVANQIVVQLKSTWLLLADDNVTDLQEHACYLGVLGVEGRGTLDAT